MARSTVIGIQLPPDSTGKITGAFTLIDPDGNLDASGIAKIIYLPATVIINARGEDIGAEMLSLLERIANTLDELKQSSELTQKLLGG